MKRSTTLIATALGFALATTPLMGCGSQQAAPAGDQATTEAAQTAVPSHEELVAEFSKAMDSVPECKSITIDEEMTSTYKEDNSQITSKTIYKFDGSGDQLKTSSEIQVDNVKMAYYTDGDQVVFVSDGPVYSGTVEQFELEQANGFGPYLDEVLGEKGMLTNCASNVEKQSKDGLTIYKLTLDVDKYTNADEALKLLTDNGVKLQDAQVTVGFDESGNIVSVDKRYEYDTSVAEWHLVLSDHNKTTVDPMPEATKTYEDLDADTNAKLDALFGEEGVALDAAEVEEVAETPEGSVTSEDATK